MKTDDMDNQPKPSTPGDRSKQLRDFMKQSDRDAFAKDNLIPMPAINIPKGGGALKSIDEKFQVNAANGTASLSIPLPLSKSRGDFAPSLALTYNSGSGGSPFGLGWNINLPAIKRRTDKQLPMYQDALESDIFQIDGAEDLVLKLVMRKNSEWEPDTFNSGAYLIKRYRPRMEGAFMLIEQITSASGMYWKVTGKDNTVTFYGLTVQSRITDPAEPSHIYEWLPEISFDDKGNCYRYFYAAEDLVNVPALLHEGNRLNGNQAVCNTYLKKVAYGNITTYSPVPLGGTPDPYLPVIPDATDYLFSLVIDYGDHDLDKPTPAPSGTWSCRLDPFSNCKPGFDMRTYRLCRRFLMFHNFPELDANPVMVKSLDLTYEYFNFQPVTDPDALAFAEADFITSVTENGWYGNQESGYSVSGFPPLTFNYQVPVWNTDVQTVSPENRVNIPVGLSSPYLFTDLYNEGISGILSEQSEGWYYNSNLGGGVFTPARLAAQKPSFAGLYNGSLSLQNLTGDGRKFIVSANSPNLGYFELTDEQEWLSFMPFEQYPVVDIKDPNIKFIDLNGDGMPDIVLSEENVFTWYPATGTRGYGSPGRASKPFDEEKGPAIVFADPVQSIFIADMNGDGLSDIVRIRNGEVSYWPNMGYGKFGAKVNMLNAPVFDTIDKFQPRYIHLSDINGTGAMDILYLGQNKFCAWLNLCGNAWGQPVEVPGFPDLASPNQLSVADLLGNGTACIIWSSPLPGNAVAPLKYIDLMGGNKPYMLAGHSNGMGKQVTISYKSSTYYYLHDKMAGTPWITKLGFPVQCVAGTLVRDTISGTSYSCSYTYHHGYYDHHEKEYRGFGRVEQTDTDIFDNNALADQAPVHTKTWYHTGAYLGLNKILHQYASEYFPNPSFSEYNLPEPLLPVNLTTEEVLEALRACKGMMIRQEVYAPDNSPQAKYPYSVVERNNKITLIQPQGTNLYASFLSTESEMIRYDYERNPADPRINHTLNTAFDEYGNITDTYTVAYARQPVDPANPGGLALPGNQLLPGQVSLEQQNTHIIYTQLAYTGEIVNTSTYRLPVDCETIVSELTGLTPSAGYFGIGDFTSPPVQPALKKLKHQRKLYLKDDLVTPLPLYTMDNLGMLYQTYHLAFNAGTTALMGKATAALLTNSRYIASDSYKTLNYFPGTDASGEWWVPSGFRVYLRAGAPLPFLLPCQFVDAYGYQATIAYDNHWLLMSSVTDAVNNVMTVSGFDYRTLSPQNIIDPNGNATDYKYDTRGLLVAIAMRGKGEGDVFNGGFTADLTAVQVNGFFSDPFANGPALLQGATTRFIYDFSAGGPFGTGAITRSIHANQSVDPRVDINSAPYQFSFEYTDGLGRNVMKKVQADANLQLHRWVGSGKTVYNNKGSAVMQFEPYFSDTAAYEQAPPNGVSAVLHYDPTGRVIRTDFPDGTFSKTVFDAWMQIMYDQNDTVLDSGWYLVNSNAADPKAVNAASKAAAHYDTPETVHLDSLGRAFYTVSYNIVDSNPEFYAEQTVLDLENNPLSAIDAMGNTVMQWQYDLLNRQVYQSGMDTGERWMLHDVMDKPFMQWDMNGANTMVYTYTYDPVHRPLQSGVWVNGTFYLSAYNVYGEGVTINGAADITNNLRTRLYQQFDQSGLVTNYSYEFKGNLIQGSRIFANHFRTADPVIPVIQWAGDASDLSLLSNEEYVSLVAYDALNRPVLYTRPFIPLTAGAIISPPYSGAAINNADVFIPDYGESGKLNRVDLYENGGLSPAPYVTRISHNEKGQRLCIQYGNNTVTRYTYDQDTFRLSRLLTTANNGAVILQDLRYHYDPMGNITYLLDDAQPPVFYNNKQVLSDADYTYDATYRLIQATGREQIAQNTVDESPVNVNYRNYPFDAAASPAPADSMAMRAYVQSYSYDAVGNITKLKHVADGGNYTRVFAYNNNAADRANFGVAPAIKMNNQLLATTVGNTPAIKYAYDTHGNMLNMPQLPGMAWNYRDELVSVTPQVVNSGVGQTTYYTYDAAGMRLRKATMSAAVEGGIIVLVSERFYLGSFEIYRTYDPSGNVVLERQTMHVMDDKTRVSTIDRKTIDTAGSDATALGALLPRYQYGNHLGSAAYELDGTGRIVSYEEYHPFGTTSYQAMDAALDVPMKRYRYTGKERDEESGLYYHGARYYAPWLCRWTAADPAGIEDGLNVYGYCHSNPIVLVDKNGETASGYYTITGEAVDAKLVDNNTDANSNKVFIVEKDGDKYKINKDLSAKVKITNTQLLDRASWANHEGAISSVTWAQRKLDAATQAKALAETNQSKAADEVTKAKDAKDQAQKDNDAAHADTSLSKGKLQIADTKLKTAASNLEKAEKKLATADGVLKKAVATQTDFVAKLATAKTESAEIAKHYASAIENLSRLSSESGMYSNATACVPAAKGGTPNAICPSDAPNLMNLSGEFHFGTYTKGDQPPAASELNKVPGGNLLLSAMLEVNMGTSPLIDVNQWRGGEDIFKKSTSQFKFKSVNSQFHIFFKK